MSLIFITRHFTVEKKFCLIRTKYVTMHQIMTAPRFDPQRNRVGGQ
ncbi:hypothetical protein D1BOALGB6SA_7290 [Olavius sp. associated proteobacterium Delta 1]|nr:hypothetical protein D1BOALGB6SA_7290 [Olavius sp. associated proteobacterium Delta 1]